MSENKISKTEIINAIEESGYLIEQRVEPIITSFRYFVEANDAYTDDETGKTREIDLTAISAKLIENSKHVLFPYLIVECENNKQPIVFFRSDTPINYLHHQEVKLSGIPIHFYKSPYESERISDFLMFDKFHHYCSGIFSTQYCSFHFTEKKGIKKWIALHPEEQHNTFQSIIKCLKYKIDRHFSNYMHPSEEGLKSANIQIYYPLLILQGDLYEAFLERRKLKLESRQHIQYRKQIANADNQEMFQIDVITENYLPDYLKIIEKETEHIVKLLKIKIISLEKSISILDGKLKMIKDKSKYKSILNFG